MRQVVDFSWCLVGSRGEGRVDWTYKRRSILKPHVHTRTVVELIISARVRFLTCVFAWSPGSGWRVEFAVMDSDLVGDWGHLTISCQGFEGLDGVGVAFGHRHKHALPE